MTGSPSRAEGAAAAAEDGTDPADELEALRSEMERLRESELMYRRAAELRDSLVWSANTDGRLVQLGATFSARTGLEEAFTLEGGWIDAVHPEDRERVLEQWNRSLQTGDPFEVEFRARYADGSTRIVRSRALLGRDAGGRVQRWYGSTEDIDEQRRAERRLCESEELHRITLQLTRQIVWSVAPDGAERIVSPRFGDITGVDPGEDPSLALHPDDRERVIATMDSAMGAGKPFSTECRLRVRDGSYRYFRIRSAPLQDEQGRILRWYGVGEDIHDEWEAGQARRDAEQRYRLAIEATNEAVWDYDIPGDRLQWSDNSSQILGATPLPDGPARLNWWSERIHPDDRERVAQSFEAAIAGSGCRWCEEYRFLRDDGDYATFYDRGFIIRDSTGAPVRAVGAMADVTARKQAEAEIRRMQAELIHVSRISAMGTMASTLAHELNQPLAALSNFISGARRLALADPEKKADLLAALEAAASGAHRAGEIVRRLRELVSRGTVSVQPEYLPALIDEAAVVGFVDAAARGIRRRVELDPEAAWVQADRIQIQQVLINLIRNAVEAIGDRPAGEISITTRRDGEMVEVAVADSGSGIAPEQFDTLFSRFVTTKSEGMGIGLAISRTIVELHGGKIRAENRPEGGAAFRFTLPRSDPAKNQGAGSAPADSKE